MSDKLIEQVQQHFSNAKNRIIIVSAFIGEETLEAILDKTPQNIEKIIYVRWRLQDICCRATDPGIYGVAKKHNANLQCHSALHAKAYIADESALVGSANATAPGLGISSRSNLELLVETNTESIEIHNLLASLQKESMVARQISSKQMSLIENNIMKMTVSADESVVWYPKSYYSEAINFLQNSEWSETAAIDSMLLGITVGADKEEVQHAANNTAIFTILREGLKRKTVSMSLEEIAELVAKKLYGNAYHNEVLVLPLLDWVHNCASDMHVHNHNTTNPVLTHWSRT